MIDQRLHVRVGKSNVIEAQCGEMTFRQSRRIEAETFHDIGSLS